MTTVFEQYSTENNTTFNQVVNTFTTVIEQLGVQGMRGENNYEIAVRNGFVGTEQDFINSLLSEIVDGGTIF